MKCKDCSVSVKGQCPDCGKLLVICGDDKQIVGFEHWDYESNYCDGING